MRDSVPIPRYLPVCNVLRQWKPRSSLLIESTDSMILVYIFLQGWNMITNKKEQLEKYQKL